MFISWGLRFAGEGVCGGGEVTVHLAGHFSADFPFTEGKIHKKSIARQFSSANWFSHILILFRGKPVHRAGIFLTPKSKDAWWWGGGGYFGSGFNMVFLGGEGGEIPKNLLNPVFSYFVLEFWHRLLILTVRLRANSPRINAQCSSLSWFFL